MASDRPVSVPNFHGRQSVALELILEAAGGRSGIAGSIDCPFCETKLSYSIAELNGEVSAECQTEGCIRFVQ